MVRDYFMCNAGDFIYSIGEINYENKSRLKISNHTGFIVELFLNIYLHKNPKTYHEDKLLPIYVFDEKIDKWF
jgi:hypothetical protein